MAKNLHDVAAKLSQCRDSLVHLVDSATATVQDAVVSMKVDKVCGDITLAGEAATLNKFMQFLHEKTSVANIEGLVMLAQAFIWDDLALVSSFHDKGAPVMVSSTNRGRVQPATRHCTSIPVVLPNASPMKHPPEEPDAPANSDDIIEELYQSLRMQVRESKSKQLNEKVTAAPTIKRSSHTPTYATTASASRKRLLVAYGVVNTL
ncbi:hypothetical protein H310_05136 [Aphanomyces invadans]|uniref:Uncharacterized protein n=1 Tax=Aphanomyces invadans TaxID=157072 RepID=A0A024UC32_9STRA|nr:hypothetical protein H310_05136 [Aphanomyces invadans]ETW03770.1 hypothetical protein H310_05136 [Aphanomyces invadans]|eukprot:XP_008867999.1 hypothetical protein H310_05136 [Aphanomyces invadans]